MESVPHHCWMIHLLNLAQEVEACISFLHQKVQVCSHVKLVARCIDGRGHCCTTFGLSVERNQCFNVPTVHFGLNGRAISRHILSICIGNHSEDYLLEWFVLYVVAMYFMDVYLNVLLCSGRSLDGIVSIMSRQWMGQLRNCGSVPGRDKRCFLSKASTLIQDLSQWMQRTLS